MADLSRYKNIIPEEHLPGLSRNLLRIPDVSWLLDRPHPDIDRLQGDLLKDCPTAAIAPDGQPRSAMFTVMILNNSCDLPEGRVDFVTAAPVIDFGEFIEKQHSQRSAESVTGVAQAIRENNKSELLYLPPFDRFKHGAIVLLHMACAVSSTVYRNAIQNGNRVASFTQSGFYFLLIKLTNHLARPESREVIRVEMA